MTNKITAGLIGHPVGHSKSPLIHKYWLQKYGIEGDYVALDTMPETLGERISWLRNSGFAGFNVTVPHKQSVMKLCDSLDETSRQIGAVNTVCIDGEGFLSGRNTDVFGFTENIREQVRDFSFESGTAVVLGAGGAARAVVHGLLGEGVPEIVIANRTPEKAHELAAGSIDPDRINICSWDDKSACLQGAALLVNTTSAGMAGMPALDMELEPYLPRNCVVNDIVYAPLMTELLVNARALGNPVVTGIGMLLHQARPAFEAWFGVMPEVTSELKEKVL